MTIKKVLIVNRGEIVIRIAKTLKKMGIMSVSIYSDIDANSIHRFATDEAIHINGSTSNDTYLNFDKILQAIQKSGADAVHPGFGFLSENSSFVQFIQANGIQFIGPNALSIQGMGDKIESKILAKKAGVTVIPGIIEPIDDLNLTLQVANDIKYPVILKAAAGGGGKGIRIVHNDDELIKNFSLTASEALSSFKDGRIFIEKYINNPRHIEIQILGDKYGNVVHLMERECTIQRRYQKVIEEAPSPFLEKSGKSGMRIREAMGLQSVNLAKEIGYYSAGTVEFVVDESGNFYFLEVNTRLQVEHSITEEVVRIKNKPEDEKIDLVEWMIRIENGEKLPFTQSDIYASGHSIETRIYAENPEMNFIPSSGKIVHYNQAEMNNLRVETGVTKGSEVSVYYDPMIAKICVFGNNRNNAIENIKQALSQLVIYGPSLKTNINFLEQLIRLPEFIKGEFSTNFIAQKYANGFSSLLNIDNPVYESFLIALAILALNDIKFLLATNLISSTGEIELCIDIRNSIQTIKLEKHENYFVIKQIGSKKIIDNRYDFISSHNNLLILNETLAKKKEKSIKAFKYYHNDSQYIIEHSGYQVEAKIYLKHFENFLKLMNNNSSKDMIDEKFMISPLPGLIAAINIIEGEEIEIGGNLLVIESMKMQNMISSTQKVKIKKIFIRSGESVQSGQKLIEFE